MQLRFFSIPALDPAAAEAELNRTIAAGRVAGIERQFVAGHPHPTAPRAAAALFSLCP